MFIDLAQLKVDGIFLPHVQLVCQRAEAALHPRTGTTLAPLLAWRQVSQVPSHKAHYVLYLHLPTRIYYLRIRISFASWIQIGSACFMSTVGIPDRD